MQLCLFCQLPRKPAAGIDILRRLPIGETGFKIARRSSQPIKALGLKSSGKIKVGKAELDKPMMTYSKETGEGSRTL
jgi:hypothetical protein